MATFLLLVSLISLLIYGSMCFGGCIESERDALLQFKNGLTDPSNRLANWAANGSDCCRWTGVVCQTLGGDNHVTKIHLRTRSLQEYFNQEDDFLNYGGSYEFEKYVTYRIKSALGGKLSSSLLHLKHLSYLDLSFNDFRGVPIPKFLGSLQSLRHLNLCKAGFGGTVPPHLGNLSNLYYLNLHSSSSYNLEVENLDWVTSLYSLEFLDLSWVDLSRSFEWLKVINSLPSLLELRLSNCQLPDLSPRHLTSHNFSSLATLHLSNNSFGGPIPNFLKNMTSLKELDLSINNFNSSIPNWLYDLSHLQLLSLRINELQSQVSSHIGNFTSLVTLDLSYNDDLEFENGSSNSFRNFCNLKSLYLESIKPSDEMGHILEVMSSSCVSDGLKSLVMWFPGHLMNRIDHFKNLRDLSLYIADDSMINGPVLPSFKYLCNLRSLYLSGVKLNKEINDVLAIMASSCVSHGLKELYLSGCELSGHLTKEVRYFKNLIDFDVSDNLISGPIPLSLGEMVSLVSLNLRNNRVNGSLPISLGNLTNLESVEISDNSLEGEVTELHFANLTRLTSFNANNMGKNIALRVSSNWIPPLRLGSLDLGSWNIGPHFPDWIHLLKVLSYLDLSNTGISAPFPIWFWEHSFPKFEYLNFSHNQMHGSFPNIIPFANGIRPVIDLSSNNFSGALPHISSNISALRLSRNSFSGSINHFLCYNSKEEKQMTFLNLEGNLLSGEIPNCWESWNNLLAIQLNNNKFNGSIPNSIGTLPMLQSLHLRNNNLSGEVPLSIQNCEGLGILDLSENDLTGNVSTWIVDGFASLNVLSLHANKFEAHLPEKLCRLAFLHILDLAHNGFYGPIPSCFSNFTAMATKSDVDLSLIGHILGELVESTWLVMKGNMVEYDTTLEFVRSIDLSSNKLSGEIPMGITRLAGLLQLNLSRNALTGRIPDRIGDMKELEAVDLSHNQLSGEIPPTISALTFLSKFDVSYNNLSSRIPSSTQLQSLDPSSFMGNQLCGLPLMKNCSSSDVLHVSREEQDEVDVWFFASMAFGFVIGFWCVVGSLVFTRRWRHLYFYFLNNLWEKTW